MRISILIPLIVIYLLSSCSSEKRVDYVAKVGDEPITIEEFSEDYNSFLLTTGLKDNLKIRHDFLKTMIDEETLFQYVTESNFTKKPEIKKRLKRQRDQVYLNYYFKKDIYPDLKVTDQEVREAFKRSKIKIHARHLFAPDLEKAKQLKKSLESGRSFSELAKKNFHDPALASKNGDIGWFSFGETDPAFENAAYVLDLNEISEPVKTNRGYSIIQVLEKKQDVFATENELKIREKDLRQEIKKRKQAGFLENKTDKIFLDIGMKFNQKLVRNMFDNLYKIKNEILAGNLFPEIKLEGNDNTVMISFDKKWDVRKTFLKLSELHKEQWNRISTIDDFHKALKGLIIREEIEERIRKDNIPDLPEVKTLVDKFVRERALHEFMVSFADTIKIKEKSYTKYYYENKEEFLTPVTYKIAEIVTYDSSLAAQCLDKLNSGAYFANLAKAYSVEKRSAQNGGYLGWGNAEMFGKFADIIAKADIGEIIGPLHNYQKYYLLTKLDQKQPEQLTLEESKIIIKEKILPEVQEKSYIAFIRKLRNNKQIVINDDLIKKLDINIKRKIS